MVQKGEVVFDLESNALELDRVKTIHVLSWVSSGEVQSTNDYDTMQEVLTNADVLIGHNIILYDLPVIKKVLKLHPDSLGRIVDTLALSWYLNFDRQRHGLEHYGEDYGVPKPKIEDWENLSYEDYRHRCEEDVKINVRLWKELKVKLGRLYV